MMGDGVVRRAITLRKMGDFCWTKKGGTLKGLTTPSLLLSESKAQQVTVLGTPNIYVSGHQVLTASSDVFQKKASNVSQISQSIVLFPLFLFFDRLRSRPKKLMAALPRNRAWIKVELFESEKTWNHLFWGLLVPTTSRKFCVFDLESQIWFAHTWHWMIVRRTLQSSLGFDQLRSTNQVIRNLVRGCTGCWFPIEYQ